MLRSLSTCLAIFSISILTSIFPCISEEAIRPPERFEMYVSADYTGRAADLSTSTVWSLFGPLAEPGFRLKLDGLANAYGDTGADMFSSGFLLADVKAAGDLMAGYQFNPGPLWIKLYAGAVYQLQTQVVWQVGQIEQVKGWGAAAAVETYWKASDRVWFSANVSWLQLDNNTNISYRTAYEIFRGEGGLKISSGAEGGVAVSNANLFREGKRLDLYNEFIRGGALLNLRYGTHELTLSGGLSESSNEGAWRPYATLSYGKKF